MDNKQKLFIDESRRIAKVIRDASEIAIFTHIDADGITSGSIAYQVALRLGIRAEINFLKKLDDAAVETIRSRKDCLIWMNDLGSGYISRFSGLKMVIADHHEPEIENPILTENGRTRLAESSICHLNAHLFGIEGSTEISSSTTSYFIARSVDNRNKDLSAIALVGAIGDLQDSRFGKLTGMNRLVLEDALSEGCVSVIRDTKFYGKETRPLSKLLEYSVDPQIPGVSSDPGAASRLLESLGIDYRVQGREKTWRETDIDDRRKIVSFIVQKMISEGIPAEQINSIVGETYLIRDPRAEEDDRMPSDAKEFATLINACGRYEKYDTGLNLCLGRRGEVLDSALSLLDEHRRNVANTIRMVKLEGLGQMSTLQYFHTTDRAPDSIVGTIAGILMKSKDVNEAKVVVGFAYSEGKVKVSCRGNTELVGIGLNLAEAVRIAAESVGGIGGGHSIAAGATIDVGQEQNFLNSLD
ncbi:MAG: DHH family phosphoesterase, partial [Thermoplasmata archaeon]|nr:DHH family phosphoesterase [Candidatus Sysuiplasma superficiale]